jgi:hypothetical protein
MIARWCKIHKKKGRAANDPALLELGKARILITNFHAFKLREMVNAPKLTRDILGEGKNAFTEIPDQMVRPVCRGLGSCLDCQC